MFTRIDTNKFFFKACELSKLHYPDRNKVFIISKSAAENELGFEKDDLDEPLWIGELYGLDTFVAPELNEPIVIADRDEYDRMKFMLKMRRYDVKYTTEMSTEQKHGKISKLRIVSKANRPMPGDITDDLLYRGSGFGVL